MHEVRYHNSGKSIEFPKAPPAYWARIILAVVGLFPLYAPYDLLLRPGRKEFFNLEFLFMALISLGAIVVSIFFLFVAFGALNQYARFDALTRTLIYGYETGVTKFRQKIIPFQQIESVGIKVTEWSEGPPSYSVAIQVIGERVKLLGISSQEEAVRAVEAIQKMLTLESK